MTIVKQERLSPGLFLLLIILLSTFAPISTDMYLPALGDMVDDLGTTESILNMTLYGYMLVLAFSMLVMGPLIDKYGRKRLLVACCLEYIVVTFAAAFTPNVEFLIICRVLQAVGSGGVMTISTAFVKDSYYGPAMSRVLNIVAIIGILGPVVAPIAGSALINVWGWRSTFIAPAVFAVICLAISLFVTETLPEGERVSGGLSKMLGGMKKISRNRSFMMFMVLFCALNLPFMGYLSVSSYIYEDTFGFSGSMYSLMLAVVLVSAIVIMIVVNAMTRRVVNKRMLPFPLVMGVVGAVLLLTVASDSWVFFLLAFVFILGASTYVRPWGMGVLMRSHPGDSGTMSSMINFVFFIIGTVGMVSSTLPWPDYITGLGILAVIACIVYAVLMVLILSCGVSDIRELRGTPSGEDLQ